LTLADIGSTGLELSLERQGLDAESRMTISED